MAEVVSNLQVSWVLESGKQVSRHLNGVTAQVQEVFLSSNISFEYDGQIYNYPEWLTRIVKEWTMENVLSPLCFTSDTTKQKPNYTYFGRKTNTKDLSWSNDTNDYIHVLPYPFVSVVPSPPWKVRFEWRVAWCTIRWEYGPANKNVPFFDTIEKLPFLPYPMYISMLPESYKKNDLMCFLHAYYSHLGLREFDTPR